MFPRKCFLCYKLKYSFLSFCKYDKEKKSYSSHQCNWIEKRISGDDLIASKATYIEPSKKLVLSISFEILSV